MTVDSPLPRRALLLGLPAAALAATIGSRAARATGGRQTDPVQLASATLEQGPSTLRDPTLLVAGPADAGPGLWAKLLAPRLGAAMMTQSALSVSATGGRDGVTGANAFEALTTPDGSTAMLVPGAAAIAWLAGDPRVHFDAGRWVPALASLSSGVLVAKVDPAGILAGRHLRVAASTATGPELPALLGLSMLSAEPSPVFGLSEPQDAVAALKDGRVDAVFLTGHDVPQRLKVLVRAGYVPLFSLGGSDDDIEVRDPAVPNVATFAERFRQQNARSPSGPLFSAWRSTAAAARLDVALVLPMLSPATVVARWRSACQTALGDVGLVSAAKTAQVNPVPAPECVQALARIGADETTQLTLRRWLAVRKDWRPA
ncbi:hypothetical protein HN018_12215 [Lichenicola cladoniae]|uniref:Uncharacterized protein n=1 Tax=Lichenicola cladoniae TaxID=1484109 RepID=A0A6M8HQZ5_9PROT|nr:hypothetical protein [Lichenicola cladoniae]NPD68129.1 hypothetical protein [Acetobacteraceae bacterium]QKE90700.1 hypothetical protein HN018_12215 [Lichenicola cladoniae]